MKSLIYSIFLFSLISFTGCKSFPHADRHYDIDEVVDAAEDQGINAIIHGADHKRKLYMVSWSSPKSFFNRYNFSISPTTPSTRQMFTKLKRGDRIFLKGKVEMNHGHGHIAVQYMEFKKAYYPKVNHTAGEHSRKTELPGTLKGKRSEIFYIHAVENEGKILILEHGDTIVPMMVKDNKLTKNIYRGDYVKLAYTIDQSDIKHRPTHLYLNLRAPEPVKVLSSILKLHKTEVNFTGRMVMFPKSPTINRNIFAVEVNWPQDPSKAPRYFTIMPKPKNFTMKTFEAILKKSQDTWDKHPDSIFKGRNKYINLNLKIKIKGTANIVSENQANPQIFADIEDLQIQEINPSK